VDASNAATPATIVEAPILGPIVAATSTPTTLWFAAPGFLQGKTVTGGALADADNALIDADVVTIDRIADGIALTHGDGSSISTILLAGGTATSGPVATTFGPASIAGSA